MVLQDLGLRCSRTWGFGAPGLGALVLQDLGLWCSRTWGSGAPGLGALVLQDLGLRCSRTWGSGAPGLGALEHQDAPEAKDDHRPLNISSVPEVCPTTCRDEGMPLPHLTFFSRCPLIHRVEIETIPIVWFLRRLPPGCLWESWD
ncbi:hypothetical protein NHX12_033664 [Muraenolepis orangiensis]|uniref:Uncharacterized protein n=1 Tax=Muraenolepis orangiensis TaxID=630683 RepID=A0A9Q0E4C9_9TELE|nr:hypothetical protein NHX12_033664 [Muraenolepis orangiensis]